MPSPVLQVVLSLSPGGTERLVVDLVRRLHHEIPMAVCCLDLPGAWGKQLTDLGISVIGLERSQGFQPRLGHAIARVAAAHLAEVLHCHHYSPFVYGCLARLWRPRMRVLFTEHGRLSDAPPSRKRRYANTLLSTVPAGVFAVSDDLKRHLVAEGFSDRNVRTIYNGIEIGPVASPGERDEVRRGLGVTPETLVVATVARLDPVKDLGSLIDAMSLVIRRVPATLIVIGDGPERRRLEEAAAASPAAGVIRFLGHRDDARRWLGGCDVYVNCSVSEGVSLTILEAMAASLPVVATGVGGTPEVVEPGSGRLIPARNTAALAAALLELAGDPRERAQLGQSARQRAIEHFSIERMVGDYRALYLGA